MDKLTLGRVLWRSFFLQAAWNHQSQQSLGFASAMAPALVKLHPQDAPGLNDALTGALRPFNTQPYMSSPILGALVRVAEAGPDSGLDGDKQTRFKIALSTAFAAIGDAFFWNGLLPAASSVGLFWALSGHITGAVVFLVAFNVFHLYFRIWGFRVGYGRGPEVARVLDRLAMPRLAIRLRVFTTGVLGILGALALHNAVAGHDSSPLVLTLVGIGGALALPGVGRLIRRGLPVEVLIYGLAVACPILGWVGQKIW